MKRRLQSRIAHINDALLIVAAGLTWATAAYGQNEDEPDWYQFEIIVFEQQRANAIPEEVWPIDLARPTHPNAVELLPVPPADASGSFPGMPSRPVAFQQVRAAQFVLGDVANRLQRDSRYTLLVHQAWAQPVPGRDHPVTVHVHDDAALPGTDERVLPQFGPGDTLLADQSGPAGYVTRPVAQGGRLDGLLTISRGRYLHVDADLYLQTGAGATGPGDAQPERFHDAPLSPWVTATAFRLQESRRMRSNEVHYLDHPLLGMLIIATPVELPAAPEPLPSAAPFPATDAAEPAAQPALDSEGGTVRLQPAQP